jgi:diamine N-acetyltransferase
MWPKNLSGNYLRETVPALAAILERTSMSNDLIVPTRASKVSLREITIDDVRAVCMLDVGPGQDGLVAPNAVSIAQAHFSPEAWFRAVYADSTPVGFAMLEDFSQVLDREPKLYDGERYVSLWRFMIDHRYQGMGFGAQAIQLLIAQARSRPNVKNMLLSFVPKENNPEAFYQRFGFVRTGEEEDGELIMRLALTQIEYKP